MARRALLGAVANAAGGGAGAKPSPEVTDALDEMVRSRGQTPHLRNHHTLKVATKWRSGVPPRKRTLLPDGMSNLAFLESMMPSAKKVHGPSTDIASALLLSSGVTTRSILCENLKAHLPNDGCRALWDESSNMDLNQLSKAIPISCLVTLFSSIDVEGYHQKRAVGDIVKILIAHAKNTEEAQNAAVAYLAALSKEVKKEIVDITLHRFLPEELVEDITERL